MKKATILIIAAFLAVSVSAQTVPETRAKVWEKVEITFQANNDYKNPYMDVDLWIDLKGPEKNYRIPAFWDGGNTWRARLVATTSGHWQWSTGKVIGDSGLDEQQGSFTAEKNSKTAIKENPNLHGFICVHPEGHTLEYADGTPFFFTGDTWWNAFTGIYAWDSNQGAAGISFKDALAIRKSQGFNGLNIITCFPSDKEHPIWHPATHGKKVAENGARPFFMTVDKADHLRINPEYWQYVDRKFQYLWDNGFIPFTETVRRSESWPEREQEQKDAFTQFVRYYWARYGCYNMIFSWLHWDYGVGRNEAWRPMIAKAYAKLGDMPYGQPKTAMAAGASDNTWGHRESAAYLDVHNVSNVGRDAEMYPWLRRQYHLKNPMPSLNVEPYYPGWVSTPPNELKEAVTPGQMARFQMYGSVLNGGFGGHAWGDGYYAGVNNQSPKDQPSPHVEGLNKWNAFSMGHLKSFILDTGHDYKKLVPATTTNLVDNRDEFLSLAVYEDTSLGLGYITANRQSSDLKNMTKNVAYSLEWWDPDKGEWILAEVIKSDPSGGLDMPSTPDIRRDWAFRIKLKN